MIGVISLVLDRTTRKRGARAYFRPRFDHVWGGLSRPVPVRVSAAAEEQVGLLTILSSPHIDFLANSMHFDKTRCVEMAAVGR